MKRRFLSLSLSLATLLAMPAANVSAFDCAGLQMAKDLAIDHSLQLKEAEARIQMKLAECLQAGLAPNPALLLEFDEIRCSSRHSTFGRLEATFGITQLIELGDKRTARQNVIAAEASIVMWEWASLKEGLIKKVTDAYIDLYALHAKTQLLDQTLENATKMTECLTEQVKQGKVSLLAQKRSRLAENAIMNDQKRLQAELAAIKRQLVLLCGEEVFEDSDCQPNLSLFWTVSPLLPLDAYLALVPSNPELSQLSAIQLTAHHNYHLQKANAIPDVALTAGVERDSPYGGCRLLFGIGFELPISNRNQGNISRANWEGYAALYKHQDLEREMLARCQDLYADLQRSYGTINLLSSELIPTAQEMLKIHENREKNGKEDCLEALATYHELFEYQAQYTDAIREYHHLKASLRLLCGDWITPQKGGVCQIKSQQYSFVVQWRYPLWG